MIRSRSLYFLFIGILFGVFAAGVSAQQTQTALSVVVQSLGTTKEVTRGQKNVPVFAFTATTEGSKVKIANLVLIVKKGALSFAGNYQLWIDANGDGTVETIAPEKGAASEGDLEFDDIFGGGYTVPAQQSVRFEVRADVAATSDVDKLQLSFGTDRPYYIVASIPNGKPLLGIQTDGSCRSSPCEVAVTTIAGPTVQLASSTTLTCSETDSGFDPSKKGVTTIGNIRKEDTCTSDNKGVLEYDCAKWTENSQPANVFLCSGTCRDGACVTEQNECFDTDGGWNAYEKGTMTDPSGVNGRTKSDYCQDASWLFEYTCGTNISTDFNHCQVNGPGGCRYQCPNGCRDGACIGNSSSSSSQTGNPLLKRLWAEPRAHCSDLVNGGTDCTTFDLWAEATLPNGSLAQGNDVTITLSEWVPEQQKYIFPFSLNYDQRTRRYNSEETFTYDLLPAQVKYKVELAYGGKTTQTVQTVLYSGPNAQSSSMSSAISS
ncbi:MAG: hypothetical protein PHO54_04630, partial [Candidatus Peribacteraceae bacterium]|nr:hypothetical protein [Candidatus Peribacteraceae bacterium]